MRTQGLAIRGLILFGVLLVGLSSTTAQSNLKKRLEREKAALDSLETKIKADRKALKKTTTEKKSVAVQIGSIEQRIVRAQTELKQLHAREENLSQRLDRTSAELKRAESSLDSREHGVAERLRETYKQSRRNPLALLLSSGSFSEGVRRFRYLEKAAMQDQVELRALRAGRVRLHETLQLRRAQFAHQASIMKAKQTLQRDLKRDATEKEDQLKWLERQAGLRTREIQETIEKQAESEAKIGEIIKEIEHQKRAGLRLAELPAFDFLGRKGTLRWPAKGPVASAFGRRQDPKLKTWTFNRGIGIAAAQGDDVQAVAPGEVVLVDWFRGYGQFVLLRHPNGYYTLYGHLASRNVGTGEILDEGAILGTAGSTGRLDGKAMLHFELMQGEDALDPIPWLEAE